MSLLVVIFIFCNSIGQQFRADVILFPPLRQALFVVSNPVGRTLKFWCSTDKNNGYEITISTSYTIAWSTFEDHATKHRH